MMGRKRWPGTMFELGMMIVAVPQLTPPTSSPMPSRRSAPWSTGPVPVNMILTVADKQARHNAPIASGAHTAPRLWSPVSIGAIARYHTNRLAPRTTVAPSRDSRIQSPVVRGPMGMRSSAQAAPNIATRMMRTDAAGRSFCPAEDRRVSYPRITMPTAQSAVTRASWFQKRRVTPGSPEVLATRRSDTAARIRADVPGIRPRTCGPCGVCTFATNHTAAAPMSRRTAYRMRRVGSRLASPAAVIDPSWSTATPASLTESRKGGTQRREERRARPGSPERPARPERIRSHHRPTKRGHPPNGQDRTLSSA